MSNFNNLVLILTLLLTQNPIKTSKSASRCYLPDGCRWLWQITKYYKAFLLCDSHLSKFDMTKLNRSIGLCSPRIESNEKIFLFKNFGQSYILGNEFELFEMVKYSSPTLVWNSFSFSILNLKGFRTNLALDVAIRVVSLSVWDSKFDFYDSNYQLIRSCQQYVSSTSRSPAVRNFLFSKKDVEIEELKITNLVNSFFKKNVIQFLNKDDSYLATLENSTGLNSNIRCLWLDFFYGLDLDTTLLKPEIFRQTEFFAFIGVINAIQVGLFDSFRSFRLIVFGQKYFLDLVRKRGIEWIRGMNSHVKVNLSDSDSFREKKGFQKTINLNYVTEETSDYKKRYFIDADFCLIRDFPFDQMVVLMFDADIIELTCSNIWLAQTYPLYAQLSPESFNFMFSSTRQFLIDAAQNSSLLELCDFATRLRLCNQTGIRLTHRSGHFKFDFAVITRLMLVVFTTMMSILGATTNSLVIFLVLKQSKQLKENHYKFMAINAASNLVLFVIQILGLINECQYPFGLFCSSVRKSMIAQYFKIVVVETIASFVRLFSNFTYAAFSLSRIALINNSQAGLTARLSGLNLKCFLFTVIIFATPLSIVKGFRFKPNSALPDEDYPFVFYRNLFDDPDTKQTIYSLIFAFDAVYEIVNNVLFTSLNLALDVLLFVKVRRTLAEKEERIKEVDKTTQTKQKKENQETIRRVFLMVISNAVVNLVGKLPASIVSLNDLRLLSRTPYERFQVGGIFHRDLFQFPYSMKFLCYNDDVCLLFQSFGTFLYITSLSVQIFFYVAFDKNFNAAFEIEIFSFVKYSK